MILIGLCVKNQTKKIYLITGAAGFIGSSLCLRLANNNKVIGIDNLSKDHNYFIKIKRYQLVKKNIFKFYKLDINDENKLNFIISIYSQDYSCFLSFHSISSKLYSKSLEFF